MCKDALTICLLALLLEPLAATRAAEMTGAQPPVSAEPELGEVVVTARHSHPTNPQEYFDWLARLVGEFTVDGYFDTHPAQVPPVLLAVHGEAECIGFGVAPGVECQLSARWPETPGSNSEVIPDGKSTLDPAVMLFGFNPGTLRQPGYTVQQVIVDDRGIAESGAARFVGPDTVMSRSPCASTPEDCERTVSISAQPDLQTVDISIEQATSGQNSFRYRLVLQRVPGSKSVVYGRKATSEQAK